MRLPPVSIAFVQKTHARQRPALRRSFQDEPIMRLNSGIMQMIAFARLAWFGLFLRIFSGGNMLVKSTGW
jgi:hypothetical protein